MQACCAMYLPVDGTGRVQLVPRTGDPAHDGCCTGTAARAAGLPPPPAVLFTTKG